MVRYKYEGKGYDNWWDAWNKYPPATLREMFYSMLRIRRIEEAIEARYHEDEMKTPIHLVIGQEAVSVGVCEAMLKSDLLFCGHRTHGAYLAKGGNLNAMLAELYCRATGCAGSKGGSMHLIDKDVGMAGSSAIVAGIVPIAAGAAFAAKYRHEDVVICAMFGDAAVEEGAMWETINFAVLKKLPIVFVCENNFYSVFTPLDERQPNVEIYSKAEAFGMPARAIDGTNVLEVCDAMTEAVERARCGAGPSFLECKVYRWRGHGGAGDDSAKGYRDAAEVMDWQTHCPVAIYGEFLSKKDILRNRDIEEFEAHIQNEIDAAFTYARNSALPTQDDLWRHVYSD